MVIFPVIDTNEDYDRLLYRVTEAYNKVMSTGTNEGLDKDTMIQDLLRLIQSAVTIVDRLEGGDLHKLKEDVRNYTLVLMQNGVSFKSLLEVESDEKIR